MHFNRFLNIIYSVLFHKLLKNGSINSNHHIDSICQQYSFLAVFRNLPVFGSFQQNFYSNRYGCRCNICDNDSNIVYFPYQWIYLGTIQSGFFTNHLLYFSDSSVGANVGNSVKENQSFVVSGIRNILAIDNNQLCCVGGVFDGDTTKL